MSLDKAVEHKKEYREKYRGAKEIDKTCRNHGGDPWCEENRKYKYKKSEDSTENQLKEYKQTEETEEEDESEICS